MTALRRRPRAVYRVCSEEEYLAGVDPFSGWEAPAAAEPKHGHSLHRYAGVAALTGAVGTVGGVIALGSLHAHPIDRSELAERVVPSMRMAAPRRRVSAAHVTLSVVAHRSPPRRRHAARPVQVALAPRRMKMRSAAQAPAPAPAASVPQAPVPMASASQDTPSPVASAAQSTPAQDASGPRAQSEFGFER